MNNRDFCIDCARPGLINNKFVYYGKVQEKVNMMSLNETKSTYVIGLDFCSCQQL